jgi:hypothetical protein
MSSPETPLRGQRQRPFSSAIFLLSLLASVLMSAFVLCPHAYGLHDVKFAQRDEDLRIVGADGSDETGAALAVGDVNGDGRADILIGALGKGPFNMRPKAGEVSLFLGAPDFVQDDIKIENVAARFFGPTIEARLGHAVAVGDLNDDGFGDIIMGAPEAPSASPGGEGAVYVFFGGLEPPFGPQDLASETVRPDLILWGTWANGRLGNALAVGDFDGDGREDIAIAAPREGDDEGRPDAGNVYVYFGRENIVPTTEVFLAVPGLQEAEIMRIRGRAASDIAGQALAVGDVNGDGFDDLLIGAPRNGKRAQTSSGEVSVLFGGPQSVFQRAAVVDLDDPTQVNLRVAGPLAGDRFGITVGAADINGDGAADVLVGAPKSELVPGLRSGRAYAIFGADFAPGTTIDIGSTGADISLVGPVLDAQLGRCVTGGDLNGDGIDDWIVGAPGADMRGQTYRILGREDWSATGAAGVETLGARDFDRAGEIAVVGDVSGDGTGDLIVSSPGFDGTSNEQPNDRNSGAVYIVLGDDLGEAPIDDCVDSDQDGFAGQGRACGPRDCDDGNAATHPMVTEDCFDGTDNNCNGIVDGRGSFDLDEDGWPSEDADACIIPDCDDQDPATYPGASENCTDGIDNNCDGLVDTADPTCTEPEPEPEPEPLPAEVCSNCVDDDGNGLGDLLDAVCAPLPLDLKVAKVKRSRKSRAVIKKVILKGSLPDTELYREAEASIDTGGGLDSGKQQRTGSIVLRSATRPKARLLLKPTRTARLKVRYKQKGKIELLTESPPAIAFGIYGVTQPYSGVAALRTNKETTE